MSLKIENSRRVTKSRPVCMGSGVMVEEGALRHIWCGGPC
jgi:hypothetical protein